MAATSDRVTELQAIGSELLDLSRAAGLQSWDQETMMPPSGARFRARQRATLQGIAHERLTRSRVGELLDALAEPAASGELTAPDAAAVRVLRREYDRAVKLPNAFVKELAQTTAEGVEIWRRARQESRWIDFAPALEHIVDLKRIEAEYVGYADDPYDALLDRYEPGMTTAQLTPLFAALRDDTVALLGRLRGATRRPDATILERSYDLTTQWSFGTWLLGAIGFDFQAGRLDPTTHPFALGLGPGDVRLTTRQSEHNLSELLFGNLHEGGHGLYEQGQDPALAETVVGQSVSLGIHESQSRLWENCVGRDLPFWRFAYPRLQATFPTQLGAVPLETFVLAINKVEPSLIRVEADEVTYNLHIILRYEIERRLLSRAVRVAELPGVWNELMRDYLGVVPPDDRSGVLQDTHWAIGYLGYFPTYTLGNLYGAQLWAAVRRDLPDLDDQLARGECGPLLGWMRERVHRPGRLYQPAELIERATGAPPQPEHLVRYLNDKLSRLYGLT